MTGICGTCNDSNLLLAVRTSESRRCLRWGEGMLLRSGRTRHAWGMTLDWDVRSMFGDSWAIWVLRVSEQDQ